MLETECYATGEVRFVQVVGVPCNPASTPKWVAPDAAITGGSNVGWSPSELTSQAEVFSNVVLRARAERISELGR